VVVVVDDGRHSTEGLWVLEHDSVHDQILNEAMVKGDEEGDLFHCSSMVEKDESLLFPSNW